MSLVWLASGLRDRPLASVGIAVLSLLPLLLGMPFIEQPGLYEDEALFGAALYSPRLVAQQVSLGWEFPTMILEYLGTLKAALFVVVFALWPPSPASVRIPPLVLASLTTLLWALLLRRFAGAPAALLLAALLGCDATFVVSSRLDWGPVALQHLLAAAGVSSFAAFVVSRQRRYVVLGAFLFGLGVWDKALFVWMLAGLTAAAALFLWRSWFAHLRLQHLLLAFAGFTLGAMPFLLFNLDAAKTGGTLQRKGFSTQHVLAKMHSAWNCLQSEWLLQMIVRHDPPPQSSELAKSGAARAVIAASDWAGHPRRTFTSWAFAASLPLAGWLWLSSRRDERKRRLAAVAASTLVALLVAWSLMLLTREAGYSAHHIALLWPLPHLFIASTFAALWQAARRLRPFVALAVLSVALSNLAVVVEFYSLLLRNGGGPSWSDAIYAASQRLNTREAKAIVLLDWGLLSPLRLLNQGALPLHMEGGILAGGSPDWEGQIRIARYYLSSPGTLFLTNTVESFPGTAARLDAFAVREGYRHVELENFPDSYGRPVIRLFRYELARTEK